MRTGPARWWDLAFVAAVLGAYLALLPGAPHLDGIRWADAIAAHRIDVNPNYLLMQPLVMWAFSVWESLGGSSDPVHFAKLFDALCGAVSLAVMAATLRALGVGMAVRWCCLLLTAFSANFLLLATSDHIKLVTAPFLFAGLHFAVLQAREPTPLRAAATGVSLSLAVCTLVNAVVWGALLAPVIWLVSGPDAARRLRHAALYCVAAGLPALAVVLAFHAADASGVPLLEWLTRYSADPEARGDGFQGVSLLTLGRFAFAILKNFVHAPDLSAAAKAALSGVAPPPASAWAALNAVAATVAVAGLGALVGALCVGFVRGRLDPVDRRVLLVLGSMAAAFLLFGFAWNDSDEEFWFQITPPLALAAGLAVDRGTAPRWGMPALAAVAGTLALNQLVSFAVPRAVYPYAENLAALRTDLSDCGYILYDEPDWRGELMMGLRRESDLAPHSIMTLARAHRFEMGPLTAAIEAGIAEAHAQGRPFCVVGIFEASDYEFPWTNFAERFGITRARFVEVLRAHGAFRRREVAGQPVYVLDPPAEAGTGAGAATPAQADS